VVVPLPNGTSARSAPVNVTVSSRANVPRARRPSFGGGGQPRGVIRVTCPILRPGRASALP
jgi:hypothetical protein